MQKMMLNDYEVIRTTVSLPAMLAQRGQHFVDTGKIPNRNTLIVTALEQFIIQLEEDEIDRQFAAMADDVAYQELNTVMAESFAESDWEALAEGESVPLIEQALT